MKSRNVVSAIVLLAFTPFSLFVVIREGYFGFVRLAYHDWWALQMLLDLVIALTLVSIWLRRDAYNRGIPAWPYLVTLPLFGSISPLVYLLHRELKR